MLVSETHFTDKSYFNIPHYTTYQTNHPDNTAHAGAAIIIKNSICHVEQPKYEADHLQASIIKVKMKLFELTVASVYCPPRHNMKKEDYSNFFGKLGGKFIAGGDYNSKNTLWGSRITTIKGRELAALIHEQNYSFLSTGTPTYWPSDPNKIPDLLDLFFTYGISSSYMEVIPSYDLSSDHSPIIATISSFAIHKKPHPRLHNNRTNWDEYRTKIQNDITLNVSLKSSNEIDETLTQFVEILTNAAQYATPETPTQNQTYMNIPTKIKKLIAIKRNAKAKWHKSHAPEDKTALNRAANHLKSEIKEAKEKSFHEYITNLNRFDNSIWKPIKHSRKPKPHVPPVRNETAPNPHWARSDEDKAATFADYLANVFTPIDNEQDQEVETFLHNIPPNIPAVVPFTPKEIQQAIRNLNHRKAPGIDRITPKMLKELPRKGIVLITYLFNAILRLQYWPTELKTAEIILIQKPGKNPNNVSSYRPISLLSIIAKLLERLLLQRINTDPSTETWIPSHQFGFRESHSTVQQTHRISHEISKALESKKYCTSVFLDVSQAFDKVWHPGLLFKIKNYLPIAYFNILKSYLSDRQFRVRVNESTSNNFTIQSGVPQGSVLGPLLYILYTADLPIDNNTTTGTFADDTVILAAHEDPIRASTTLQNHLDQIQTWLQKWRIKINETKSAQVNFTLRREKCPQVQLNNIPIPQSASTKYLGIHIDSKLTWKEHIVKKRKQIDLKIKELHWLIGRKSKLSLENKLLLYKSIIKPIWVYGIEIWGCASISNINIIQRSQSKILRMLVDAPWYVTNQTLHEDLNIPYVKDVIKDKSVKHHDKLVNHTNTILHPLLNPHNVRRLKRLWPADLRGD